MRHTDSHAHRRERQSPKVAGFNENRLHRWNVARRAKYGIASGRASAYSRAVKKNKENIGAKQPAGSQGWHACTCERGRLCALSAR